MIRTLFGGLLVLMVTACSKNNVVRPGNASLVIISGLADANPIRTSFSTTPPAVFITANVLMYAYFTPGSNLFHPIAGNVPLRLYQQPDTLPKSTPLYSLDLNLPEGSIHSLFLTGTVSAPESIFVKDELPYFPAGDSAMGMRFVNLMPENIPVRVNLVSKPHGSEVSDLPYKAVTEFKKYPVKMEVADYVFEFRHAITGNLIASHTTANIANDGKLVANTWLYRNYALVLVGKLNGTGALAPKILRVPYARS